MQKLHVIAVSKLQNQSKLEVYIYYNEGIYLYFPNSSLNNKLEYSNKIKEIATLADLNMAEWSDFWIENGDVISRKNKDIYINNKKVIPFSKLSDEDFANIGPVTAKIYNEYIRSREKNSDAKEFLKESFDEGIFSSQISDIVEESYKNSIDFEKLNNLDKQIIVRVKIEGYNFIINFMKNLINSGIEQKDQYCEIFMSRVLMLESQNYIKVIS